MASKLRANKNHKTTFEPKWKSHLVNANLSQGLRNEEKTEEQEQENG